MIIITKIIKRKRLYYNEITKSFSDKISSFDNVFAAKELVEKEKIGAQVFELNYNQYKILGLFPNNGISITRGALWGKSMTLHSELLLALDRLIELGLVEQKPDSSYYKLIIGN